MLTALACLLVTAPVQGDTLPALNACIVEYALSQEGHTVARGECWDLAAAALDRCEAQWDGLYGFGRRYDPKKDPILPGDILRFEGVTMETRTTDGSERYTFGEHTAIVVVVPAPGRITIAHQNFGPVGRKVSQLNLDLASLTKGRIHFHRPVP